MQGNMADQPLKEQLKLRLRESDPAYRYYKTIFNLTSDLIALSDGDRIIDANLAFITFFEGVGVDIFTPSFRLSKHFEEINKYGYVYDGYQGKRWFETILLGEKEHYRVGIAVSNKLYTFNLSVSPIDPVQGVYVITLADVTEMMGYRSVLEEGLRTSVLDKEETQLLLEQYDHAINVSNLVAKCNLEGKIIYVNDAFCQTLHYTHDELIYQHVSKLFFTDSEAICQKAAWEGLEQGEIWKGVLKNKGRSGSAHYFDSTLFPLKNKEGKVIEILSIRHEITEMMEAKEKAIQTLEAKTKFFDQVSHELRTPLNAIVNFTDQALESFEEMFEDAESRDLVKMYLERAYKNSQNLLSLINSLLDIAKLSSGKETFAIEQYDAVPLVREAFENCTSLNKNSEVEYKLNVSVSSALIQCDPFKFRQIITNLISNAFKFTHFGFIEVRIDECDEICSIEVADSGIGIPNDKLSSIFEPFQQAREHDVGTGLGLSLVREYSHAMGFSLEVSSSEGEGTCFTLKQKQSTKKGDEWVI